MKKILLLVIGLMLVVTLTGCQTVEIVDGEIGVIYNDYWFEEDIFVLEVHITNGTDTDFDLTYTEFWLELPDETMTEVMGAGFDLNDVVPAGGYITYELEYTSEFIYYSTTDLEALDLTYADCDLYYYFEGLE